MTKEELLNEFLNTFPLEKLKTLKIDEYVLGADDNTFSRWVEFKTSVLGDIRGANSYIHGIFKVKNPKDIKSNQYLTDGTYSWCKRYGLSKEEAFNNIRKNIIDIATLSANGKYGEIQKIKFAPTLKAKIAFLYSEKKLVNIFSEDAIDYLADEYDINSDLSFFEKSHELSKKISDGDWWIGAEKLWEKFENSKKEALVECEEMSLSISFSDNLSKRYISSLLTKPFVILSGNSGTGKTRIALTLAKKLEKKVSVCTNNIYDFLLDYKGKEINGLKIKSVSETAIEVFNTKNKIICISLGIINEYITYYKQNGITASLPVRDTMQQNGNYDGQSYSWDSTQIAKIAKFIVENSNNDGYLKLSSNILLLPVGADWTDNTKILGYYNPIDKVYVKTPVLELIERANENPEIPFFLILDEMNLSHVERYFSDFLSLMETPNEQIKLDHYGKAPLKFPKNLFVTGTVNIDETTYMFSSKVLDRANVIEFKPKKDDVLKLMGQDSELKEITPANDGSAEAFLQLAEKIRESNVSEYSEINFEKAKNLLNQIYDCLEKRDFEFAFRTMKEIRQYIIASYELCEDKNTFNIDSCLDEQIVQKILPKIHGNKKQIGELLEELENICTIEKYPLSNTKLVQMKNRLAKVQYTSFV